MHTQTILNSKSPLSRDALQQSQREQRELAQRLYVDSVGECGYTKMDLDSLRQQIAALQQSLQRESEARLAADEAREAAEVAQRAAEAGRMQDREAREAAEVAQRAAEAGLVQEREAREAAEVAQRAAEMDDFLSRMRGICSSTASESSSNTDKERRGAPEPQQVPLAALLDGAEILPSAFSAAADAWAAFKTSHAHSWAPPPTAKVDENLHVHPTIARLLRPLVPPHLRLWCNVITVDDVGKAEVKPDFSFTHQRDAMLSLLGSVLLVEVKLPGALLHATRQAIAYARRRMFKLCCESLARSEPLHLLHAYALATDGREATIVRVRSGAPAPGGSYKTALPCPADVSESMALLGDWDFVAPPVLAATPPAALPVLLHLLAQPQLLLGPEAPMTRVRVVVTLEEDVAALAQPVEVQLVLGQRLGLGGTSDAYACSVELGEGEAVAAGSSSSSSSSSSMVLKVARHASDAVRKCFGRERNALRALASTELLHGGAQGPVPRLVWHGQRAGLQGWPVLVLEPRGVPLCDWSGRLCQRGGGGGGGSEGGSSDGGCGGGAAEAARMRFATAMSLDVLKALQVAHGLGIIHADVRPSNIVVREKDGMAVLIDWGLSRAAQDECSRCGVAAFACDGVFLQGSYKARPAQDLCALLYTWLSAVHSASCEAPWLASTDERMYAARSDWLQRHSNSSSSGGVAKVVALLAQLEAAGSSSKKDLHAGVRKVLQSIIS